MAPVYAAGSWGLGWSGRVFPRLAGGSVFVGIERIGCLLFFRVLKPRDQHIVPPRFIHVGARVDAERLNVLGSNRRVDGRGVEFCARNRFG